MAFTQQLDIFGNQHLQEQNLMKNGFACMKDYLDSRRLDRVPEHLLNCSDAIKDNRALVLKAITTDGGLFVAVSERLKDDKNLLLVAIENGSNLDYRLNNSPLKFASERLRNDKDIVLTAIHKNSSALEFASDSLKNDKEVVLAAVTDDVRNIKFASKEIQKYVGQGNPRELITYSMKMEELINLGDRKIEPKKQSKPTRTMKI